MYSRLNYYMAKYHSNPDRYNKEIRKMIKEEGWIENNENIKYLKFVLKVLES